MAQLHETRERIASLLQIAAAAVTVWGRLSRKSAPAAEYRHFTDSGTAARKRPEPRMENRQSAGTSAGAATAALKQEPYPKALLHVAIGAGKAWSTHRAASKGAALALYTLFSLAPMLVLVVTIAGFFFGEETVRKLLVEQMAGLMGSQGGDAIKTILAGSQHKSSGAIAGAVSAVLVLVSATSAFAELKDSQDELWEIPRSDKSGLWALIRERFLSFGLILVLALMLLASLAVSTALSALGNLWGGDTDSAFRVVSQVISTAVSFLIVTGLFAVIFKYLPATKIAWKDVAVGAVITAILFTIGKSLIGLYVAHGNISSAYGAAGSVVILITWIYYSAQIFFYGSLFTHEYAFRLGSRSHSDAATEVQAHTEREQKQP